MAEIQISFVGWVEGDALPPETQHQGTYRRGY